MFSWTLIATTGERFSGFAPYVASVNDSGTVAFQAALLGGGTGVFTGSGGEVVDAAGPALVSGVTSHPALNGAGAMSVYADLAGGGQGVLLLRDGHARTIADTRRGFISIGPLGPTMNDAVTVAFRADPSAGVSGVFTGDGEAALATIADTEGPWSRFHGLPVINGGGTVVFRADRKDGAQGIYAYSDGAIRTVAETGDFFETIARFPSVDDQGTVAMAATLRAGGAGIFTVQGGVITRIVDTDGVFEAYRGALITSAGAVVRIAIPNGESLGLFAGPDPEADRILAIGDPLLGSAVAELAANPVSVNAAGQVAIRARLADGRQVILRADSDA